jgi:ketosteroid isomerase-like protein
VSERPPSDTVRAEIERSNAALADAFARADFRAVGEAYSEDAIAYPPGAQSAHGRAAIGRLWEALHRAGGRSLAFATDEVQVSGDLAVETGTSTSTLQPPGQLPGPRTIRYLVVWKRQPDGRWTMHRDIWNGALPHE